MPLTVAVTKTKHLGTNLRKKKKARICVLHFTKEKEIELNQRRDGVFVNWGTRVGNMPVRPKLVYRLNEMPLKLSTGLFYRRR